MVTKEQAMICRNFLQVRKVLSDTTDNRFVYGGTNLLVKPLRWRANGKCKTWKREPERFQLPIKHGLYNYNYLTNENAHLFIVEE